MAAALVIQGLTVLVLWWAHDAWTFYLFGSLFGIGFGGEMSAYLVVNRQYFGRGRPAPCTAWEMMGAMLGHAVATGLAGLVRFAQILRGFQKIVVGSRSQRRHTMAETLTIRSERVDDIPLLLAQLDRMGVQPLLDEHFPTHGNWVGLSLGWVTVLWLTHILSEADHRLNHVEPWANSACTPARRDRPTGPSPGPERRPAGGGAGGLESMTSAGRPLKAPSPSTCCACTTCSPSACAWIVPRPAGTGA